MPTIKTLESPELVDVDQKTLLAIHEATADIVSAFLAMMDEPTGLAAQSMIEKGAEVRVSTQFGDPESLTIAFTLPNNQESVRLAVANGMRL